VVDVSRIETVAVKEERCAGRTAAPQAKETISYRMPAFTSDRILVWFAAHTGDIGFYPGAGVIAAFQKQLARRLNEPRARYNSRSTSGFLWPWCAAS
jgi:uncharacterized protein YdhG (YjbR/CyaY superfamily)